VEIFPTQAAAFLAFFFTPAPFTVFLVRVGKLFFHILHLILESSGFLICKGAVGYGEDTGSPYTLETK
jgi:hypothetical protein